MRRTLLSALIVVGTIQSAGAQAPNPDAGPPQLRTRVWTGQVVPGADAATAGSVQEDDGPQPGTPLAASAGLTIHAIFETTITSDPNAASITSAINTAIANLESRFSDPITVTISFGAMATGLGQSRTFFSTVPYSTYLAALKADAKTSDDAVAVARLPSVSGNPVNGGSTIAVRTANLRAVGLNASVPADGFVSVNTSITNPGSPSTTGRYTLVTVLEHEIDEVLGLASSLPSTTVAISPEDLFRYDANGARSYSTAATSAFFSINGTSSLAQFSQDSRGDYGDWQSSPLPSGTSPRVQDAFATPGANPALGVELIGLDVIGYDRVDVPGASFVVIDVPAAGSTISEPLVISGWALTKTASSGTGVDAVQAVRVSKARLRRSSNFRGLGNLRPAARRRRSRERRSIRQFRLPVAGHRPGARHLPFRRLRA